MAIGVPGDYTNYDEQFHSGILDALAENINVFNAASAGAITLSPGVHMGQYNKSTEFDRITDLVTRQDLTSSSAVTDISNTDSENIGVKINAKIGPTAVAKNSFKMQGKDPALFSFLVGQQAGEDIAKYMLNYATAALVSALGDQTDLQYDATGQTIKTLTQRHLVKGMQKRGDQAGEIVAFLGHSLPFFDMMGSQIDIATDNAAGAVINSGTVGTLGKPFIVTDNSYLINTTPSPYQYRTFGLVPGAARVEISSPLEVVVDPRVTGREQLVIRYQGEWSFTLWVKGCAWDTSTGGANPLIATVATSGNWDKYVSSVKAMAGVMVITE